MKIVSYVYDMILFAKSRKELYPAYIKIRNSIKVFHLKIDKYNVGKCVATHISKHPEFLGIDIGPNGILTIRGERVHKFKQKLWGLIDRYHHKDTTKKEKIEQINYLIEGWSGAYSMCDKTYLGALYSKLNKIVENSCRSRLKSGLINTNEYNYLIKNIRKFTLIKNKKSRGINRK